MESSGERVAAANGIEIAYEVYGDDGPVVLLVMGLGVQMLGWDEGFCGMLVDEGFRVVRFDNRDVGHSTWGDGGMPDVGAAIAGDASSASYTLDDMAEDALGLLDELGVERAHLVGASLGGMICQTMAIRHPQRVLSLASIMSTTGDRSVGQPHPEGLAALMARAPDDRAGFVEGALAGWRAIRSPGFPSDEERIRERVEASYDRGYNPDGIGRQLLAVLASGDRTEMLGKVEVPTLVIHGREDVLIDVSGGEATARAVPGARMELIEGMGHDLPQALWPRLVGMIAEHARSAASVGAE